MTALSFAQAANATGANAMAANTPLASSANAAATPSPADPDELSTIQHLAQAGYLGDQKAKYLSENLTEDQITDALLAIYEQLSAVDSKTLSPGNKQYTLDDLQALQALVKDKAEDIRARKVSSWRFDNKIQKMIAALGGTAPAPASTAAPPPTATVLPAAPTATPTPVVTPGPSRQEFESLKSNLQDLDRKTLDIQKSYDLKADEIAKSNDEMKKSNAEVREQLDLVKNLIDRVQEDLQKTENRLEQVSQKAEEKNITDTELEQELTVMHKDMRDNVQDVSVLKQEVAKLDKSGEVKSENVLDQVLDSKWLAGGALVVGLAALVVGLSNHK